MLELANRPKLGPYILTRELDPCTTFGAGAMPIVPADPYHAPHIAAAGAHPALPQRFLALHSSDNSSHVAYRFPAVRTAAEERRFQAAADSVSLIDHPHVLRIEEYGIDALGHPWVITRFTGDVDGVRSLSRLLREKGGQMEPVEVERAMEQLLRAVAAAHALPGSPAHGPIAIDEVQVDRHGALTIELYGLARAMRGQTRANTELLRDEVRSVVEIGYQLITGLRAEEPVIPAGRLVPRNGRYWDAWLARGLDATRGYDTAVQALGALPSHVPDDQPSRTTSGVRAVLSRLRAAREA